MSRPKPKPYRLEAPRTTYLLQLTHSTNNAKLDFSSHLILQWADKWIRQHGGLRAPHSGLIRRALSVYVQHLQTMDPSEARYEVHSIKSACTGTCTSREEQSAATARLEASGDPLPPFEVVLLGQHQVDAKAAMFRHLEQFNHIPEKKGKSQ